MSQRKAKQARRAARAAQPPQRSSRWRGRRLWIAAWTVVLAALVAGGVLAARGNGPAQALPAVSTPTRGKSREPPGGCSTPGGEAMKIRVHGTPEECRAGVEKLFEAFTDPDRIVSVSEPYPDRGASALIRVYLEVRLGGPAEPSEAPGSGAGRRRPRSMGDGPSHRQAGRLR